MQRGQRGQTSADLSMLRSARDEDGMWVACASAASMSLEAHKIVRRTGVAFCERASDAHATLVKQGAPYHVKQTGCQGARSLPGRHVDPLFSAQRSP
jgi:hypothetical protein